MTVLIYLAIGGIWGIMQLIGVLSGAEEYGWEPSKVRNVSALVVNCIIWPLTLPLNFILLILLLINDEIAEKFYEFFDEVEL